jgi:hypothetical protein
MKTHRVKTEFGDVTLRKKGDRWYARKQHEGKRLEKRMTSPQEDQATEEAVQWLAGVMRGMVGVENEGEPAKTYIARMFRAARRRAEANGTNYDLTREQEHSLYLESNGCCAVTGLRFRMGKSEGGYRAPFAPSIDRIDCRQGYVAGNVRVVCVAVNWALSDWGEGVFRTICAAYASKLLREVDGAFTGQKTPKAAPSIE